MSSQPGAAWNHVAYGKPQPQHSITRADTGVWLDGAYRWHNTYRVVDLAVSYGFKLSDLDTASLDAFKTREGFEELSEFTSEECASLGGWATINETASELATEATDYLQSLVTDEDLMFVWDCGLSLQDITKDNESGE